MAIHSTGKSNYHEIETIPSDFIDYLRGGVHTGRGTGHQVAMTNTIVRTLAAHPKVAPLVERGEITYLAGAKAGRRHRNLDLVFGPPGPSAVFDGSVGMLYGMPTQVLASGEYKSIMTELGKNAGNRRGDFANHARDSRRLHGPGVIVFGCCPINAADQYWTYTANKWRDQADGKVKAGRAIETLRDCVAGPPDDALDVFWTPVVVANNAEEDSQRVADWLRSYPQPPDGDEMGWGHFIEKLARLIGERF